MALVLFDNTVNMITAATPSSSGGFLVGYDIDGVLKQKDHLGVITPIGSGGGIGSLAQTLSIGNSTGVNSIYLDVNTRVRSNGGSASLRLDDGGFDNYVELSSSNLITGSTLIMDDNTIQLTGLSSSVLMTTTDIRLNFGVNQFFLQNNNSYLKLGATNVLEFTTATSSRTTGNRIPAFISSNGSRFSNTVTNSVIIGGSSIIGTQSNSVYVPNLIVKEGGYVKGTSGDGQLKFNSDDEVYLTSIGNIIGILNSKNTLVNDYSGIFITDVDNGFITKTETNNITFISSSNATVDVGLSNTVVIGGQDLTIDSADTVYLGGVVDIDNQYKLPISDGTSGQVIKTDGAGNLSWSSGVGTPVITVTVAEFALVSPLSSSSTYRITDADIDLYGGTEIYLTTNSQGILNDVGEGRFFNPKYNQTVDGYEIWAGTSSSYATGSVVYWGGRAWSNIYGVNTLASVDTFNLNLSEWTLLSYTNTTHYNISYDKIKYDRLTDKIIYRNERGTNIVSTNSENIAYWTSVEVGLNNPIKVFQWGNIYSLISSKGIGSQNIVNSYNENINFTGVAQINIIMNNLSSQFNMRTDINSLQDNLILNNYSYNRESTLLGTELNISFQSGDTITIDGNLMVKGTTTTINSENLLVKDPIILLAGSQSGTPTLDSGLFINRGIGATQAFIWDESSDEFKFISTPDGATVSGNISIGDYSNVRTGVLSVGTGTRNNSRFIVSSSGGTVSLVVDEFGNVYNRGRGNISTNTVFGESALSLNSGGYENTAIGVSALLSNISGSFNTAVGFNTLYSNTGGSNTAFGDSALYSNIIGDANIALGREALYFNINGDTNIAVGSIAGKYISGSNTSATNSSTSIFIGYDTRPQAGSQSNQIVIGHGATGYGSNTVTLGADTIEKTYLRGNIQLPTVPTTSVGTYKILTRNDITGEVEKITPYIINWYTENTTPPSIVPVATGAGSIAIGNNTKALSGNMFVYGDSAGVDATDSDFSNFIGYYSGFQTNTSPNTNAIGNYAGFQSSNSGSSNFIGGYAGFQSSGSIKSNFFGDRAGLQSPGSEYSNFIGGHAGVQSPNTGYSNFFGRDAGHSSGGASYSNFFGRGAGQGSPGSYQSNFFGDLAGHYATSAYNSNFLGQNAGSFAAIANDSNFLGQNAGHYASSAYHSNFFGNNAGSAGIYTYSNAHNSNFFGNNAGQGAISANNSNFIGERAGKGSKQGNNSNFLGQGAGQINDSITIDYDGITYDFNLYQGGNNSNFIGINSGVNSVSNNSNFFGQNTGELTFLAHHSNFFGFYAGAGANSANNSNFFGYAAGQNATTASNSNLFGYSAGKSFTSNVIGSNNIVIGTNISLPNGATNRINIGGVLFGLNTHSDIYSFNPSITAQTNGRIGINVVSPTANLHIGASTTEAALMRLEVGSAPTSPNDGDIWLESNTLTGLKIRINGVTRTITIT